MQSSIIFILSAQQTVSTRRTEHQSFVEHDAPVCIPIYTLLLPDYIHILPTHHIAIPSVNQPTNCGHVLAQACGWRCVEGKAPCREERRWLVKLSWLALLSLYILCCGTVVDSVTNAEYHCLIIIILLLLYPILRLIYRNISYLGATYYFNHRLNLVSSSSPWRFRSAVVNWYIH